MIPEIQPPAQASLCVLSCGGRELILALLLAAQVAKTGSGSSGQERRQEPGYEVEPQALCKTTQCCLQRRLAPKMYNII